MNDLADAHVRALQKLQSGGDSFAVNLGAGKGHSVREVVAAVEQVTGKKVPCVDNPRRAGDPPILIAETSRAQDLLGWKPARGLLDTVSSAWAWMQRARQLRHAAYV